MQNIASGVKWENTSPCSKKSKISTVSKTHKRKFPAALAKTRIANTIVWPHTEFYCRIKLSMCLLGTVLALE